MRRRPMSAWLVGVSVALLSLPAWLLAQTSPVPGPAAAEGTSSSGSSVATGAPVVLPEAEQFDLRSRAGLDYRIFVIAPRGLPQGEKLPVLYLTDGNSNFPVLMSAMQKQSQQRLSAVVVGIGYPEADRIAQRERRSFDLTPPTDPAWMATVGRGMSGGKTGGQDQFLDFILHDLKPVIEQRYPIDRSHQAFFGHSLGGLLALHALFTRPEAFQTYIVVSPSVWWNNRSILQEEQAFVAKWKEQGVSARVLLTAGELEQKLDPQEPSARAQRILDRKMVDEARDLSERLTKVGMTGLSSEFLLFAGEDHGSTVLPAASRGARFFLQTTR